MGRRQREGRDLLSGQGAALAVLGAVFMIGGGAGCLFAALAGGEGGASLSAYLADYLTLAADGTVGRSFWPILWREGRYWLAACVLGLTALGVAGIPLTLGVRGFFLGFSSACFCRVFGPAGLIPAAVIFGLPALLWAPALFLTGVQGLLSARQLLLRGPGEGGWPPISPVCWLRLAGCAGLELCAALVEFAAVPVLLRAAARVVL